MLENFLPRRAQETFKTFSEERYLHSGFANAGHWTSILLPSVPHAKKCSPEGGDISDGIVTMYVLFWIVSLFSLVNGYLLRDLLSGLQIIFLGSAEC